MLLNSLLAVRFADIIVDLIVILFALIMVFVCARKGFINCFFGTVSTVVALIIAFSFAKGFVNVTNGLFGLQELLQTKIQSSFMDLEGFNVDISATGIEAAIKEQNITGVLAGLIMKLSGKQETIAQGTTLAMFMGEKISGLAVTLISGFVLFVLTKVAVWFLKGVFNVIAESIKILSSVNALLGAVVGFLEAGLIVCAILAVLAIFPNQGIVEYLSKTWFVGKLYASNPLVSLLGLLI